MHLTFPCELKPLLLSWSILLAPHRTCDYFLFVIQLEAIKKTPELRKKFLPQWTLITVLVKYRLSYCLNLLSQ